MSIKPTDEQSKVLRLFLEGDDLAVIAGAGAGKTSTIKLCAEALLDHPARRQHKGLYLAFNRAIVDDARRKMPPNVDVRTIHSLANRNTPSDLKNRLGGPRLRSNQVANILGITPISLNAGGHPMVLSAPYLAGLVMSGIDKFCQSADPAPSPRHIRWINGIDFPNTEGEPTYANNNLVAQELVSYMESAWEDLQRPDGRLRFDHQHYLKQFELSGPKLGVDFILFDEAQDVSPVFASIVFSQSQYGTQVVLVGDPNQSIYEWNGAIDAFSKLPPGTDEATLSASFRFGPEIAQVANRVLRHIGTDLRLTGAGLGGWVGEVSRPDAILCRSNAKAVELAIDMMDRGEDAHLLGGAGEVRRFAFAARDIQALRPTDHPELGSFRRWSEVQDYVAFDESGADLKLMVSLMDRFTPATIIAVTDRMSKNERPGQTVISTAHRAKGREWGSVKLAGDFPVPAEGRMLPVDELRLLYVAVTRARQQLDISDVVYLAGSAARQPA